MKSFIKDFIAWLKKRKEDKKRKEQQEYYNRLINSAYKAYLEFSSKVDIEKSYVDMPFIVRDNLHQPVIVREVWVNGKRIK